jgi:membrane protein required for colicin V production
MTYLDIGVIVILAFSGLLALARGLVREILSLIGWVVAIVATFILLPRARPIVQKWDLVQSQIAADIGTGVVIFLVVLFLCALVTGWIGNHIAKSPVGPIDRFLGFIFGLARGALLAVLGFLLFQLAYRPENMPDWIKNAEFRPALERGAELLRRLDADRWFERAQNAVREQFGPKPPGAPGAPAPGAPGAPAPGAPPGAPPGVPGPSVPVPPPRPQ